jgi:hypothetical protein
MRLSGQFSHILPGKSLFQPYKKRNNDITGNREKPRGKRQIMQPENVLIFTKRKRKYQISLWHG